MACRSQLPLPPCGFWRIKLRQSGLAASVFTHRAILPGPSVLSRTNHTAGQRLWRSMGPIREDMPAPKPHSQKAESRACAFRCGGDRCAATSFQSVVPGAIAASGTSTQSMAHSPPPPNTEFEVTRFLKHTHLQLPAVAQ